MNNSHADLTFVIGVTGKHSSHVACLVHLKILASDLVDLDLAVSALTLLVGSFHP